MPKINVIIEWDTPEDSMWLNPDNIAVALHSYCTNTQFVVKEAAQRPVAADLATSVREQRMSCPHCKRAIIVTTSFSQAAEHR